MNMLTQRIATVPDSSMPKAPARPANCCCGQLWLLAARFWGCGDQHAWHHGASNARDAPNSKSLVLHCVLSFPLAGSR